MVLQVFFHRVFIKNYKFIYNIIVLFVISLFLLQKRYILFTPLLFYDIINLIILLFQNMHEKE